MNRKFVSFPLLAVVVTTLGLLFATPRLMADDSDTTISDPDMAGPDYVLQGEYLGSYERDGEQHKIGSQVIALGDGKFRLVGYFGGLPGDGWQRGDKKKTAEGKRTGDRSAKFQDDNVLIVIEEDVMTVTERDVNVTLKKVHRKSSTLGAKPPEGATVLFDGSNADKFENGKIVMKDLLLADCASKQKFGDHSLHLEFRTPFKPDARGQARGNSGMYIQSRYEVQILDSFGLEGKNNECGGIYSIAEPAVNMCYPPLSWQTYDYDFTAAKYDDDGNKVENARVTLKHNGVVIHDDLELPHGTPGRHPEEPGPEALYLQGHGNPVVFRNIWVMSD